MNYNVNNTRHIVVQVSVNINIFNLGRLDCLITIWVQIFAALNFLQTWAQRTSSNVVPDGKFNIIFFGVSESPQGMPCHTRSAQDFNSVASAFSDIEDESHP